VIKRTKFFDSVRGSLFYGTLSQAQVDGMNILLDIWELHFINKDIRWLAYALATAFHETAETMRPIEEYGEGAGMPYGEPAGPNYQVYYGRGHVQLTHEENYQKGERFLAERYGMEVPMWKYPHRMLEDEPSALVLYDGMIEGWFTGLALPDYFNTEKEDPVHARQVVNAMDKAEMIAGYYERFKDALA
jgi:hypothetical protein